MSYYTAKVTEVYASLGIPEYIYVRVRDSKHFMEASFADKIELDSIAAAACMSRFHYIRTFQQIYGLSPRKFLKDIRIRNAMLFLKDGVPVNMVCARVGYDSLPTFCSAFRKGTGFSPKAFQKRHNSNPE